MPHEIVSQLYTIVSLDSDRQGYDVCLLGVT